MTTRARLESWMVSGGVMTRRGRSNKDAFILGTTKPSIVDPLVPTADDNVGAAFGWNGVTLTVVSGDYTIPANTKVANKKFTGYVTFTNATSIAENCLFVGRAPGGAFSAGLIKGANGGQLNRCTIVGTTTSCTYYMNGIYSTGGTWTLNRCHISKVVDSWHTSVGTFKLLGCDMGPYSFWDTDLDHSTDAFLPYWSHGDTGGQRLNGLPCNDEITGCNIHGFFDRTGVTFTGGHYVNGATTIGNPAAAMNGNKKDSAGNYLGEGSTFRYTAGTYSNAITYSGAGPYTGVKIHQNWINGCSFGMILFTVTANHVFEIIGNRFGVDGRAWTGNNAWNFAIYPAGSVYTASGNVIDDLPTTPAALKNKAITFTATGAIQSTTF